MRDDYGWTDARRRTPRVGVDAMCWEDGVGQATVVDLSPDGLKLERPFVRPVKGKVQLELELPEIDDVVWLGGEVSFDRRRGRVHTTGVRLCAAAERDRRRIRDFVMERQRALNALARFDLAASSCYLRG